jgi:hypothetical protein
VRRVGRKNSVVTSWVKSFYAAGKESSFSLRRASRVRRGVIRSGRLFASRVLCAFSSRNHSAWRQIPDIQSSPFQNHRSTTQPERMSNSLLFGGFRRSRPAHVTVITCSPVSSSNSRILNLTWFKSISLFSSIQSIRSLHSSMEGKRSSLSDATRGSRFGRSAT